jgi:hypothetical protein
MIIPTKKGVRPRTAVTASTDATKSSLIRAMPVMDSPITAPAFRELQRCIGRASLTVTGSHLSWLQLFRV